LTLSALLVRTVSRIWRTNPPKPSMASYSLLIPFAGRGRILRHPVPSVDLGNRNIDRSWQLLAPWAGAVIHQPALFIAGKEDHVIRGPTGERQLKDLPTTVPGLKGTVLLDGVGHYVQQERPKEVTAALLDFLRMQNPI